MNKYAEKICRANTFNPALIKLDFGQFDGIMSGADNLNPYQQLIDQKKQTRLEQQIEKARLQKEAPKYLEHFVD